MLKIIYQNLEEYLCALFSAGMILCLILQVLIRAISGSSLAWTEELSRIFFIWTVYFGVSMATKRCTQVRISAQFIKASLPTRLFFRIVSDIFCVVFQLIIAWLALLVIQEHYQFPEISPTLGIVKAHIELIIPIAFTFTAWRTIEIYIKKYREKDLYSLVQTLGEEI